MYVFVHLPKVFCSVLQAFCFAGGTNSSTVLDVVEYYSIQSNVWCDLAPLPLAVQGAGAVFVDDQLYVVGGKGETNYENRTWVCLCISVADFKIFHFKCMFIECNVGLLCFLINKNLFFM
jgi:hypothetical protein